MRLFAMAGSAGVLACAFSAVVGAQATLGASAHGTSGSFIAQYDADGDGRVTAAEFEHARKARHGGMDANGDGRVTEAEYVAEYQQRQNQEQQGQRVEHIAQTLARHAALDTDNDGTVSLSEYDAAGARSWRDFEQRRGQASAGESKRQPRALMPRAHTVEGMLALYDANADGRLTAEEYRIGRAQAFKRTDLDGDGVLTTAEYLAEFLPRLETRLLQLRQGGERQARVRFGVLDTDKDQSVSWDEFNVSGRNLFSRADTDLDGVVDASDNATIEADTNAPPVSTR